MALVKSPTSSFLTTSFLSKATFSCPKDTCCTPEILFFKDLVIDFAINPTPIIHIMVTINTTPIIK